MDGFRKLKADEIECRVASSTKDGNLMLLLYKDARVDQRLLDEHFGIFGWQRKHELIGNNLYCTVSVRDPETGDWISKQDVGTESNTEKEKGQASDSFKRACFNLGIGRELYTAPTIWVHKGDYTDNGKGSTYDRFTVSDIGYDESGNISSLTVYNAKLKKNVFTYGKGGIKQEEPKQETPKTVTAPDDKGEPKEVNLEEKISNKMVIQLKGICLRHQMPEEEIFKKYNRASIEEMTLGDWGDFGKTGQQIIEAWDKEHTA